MAITSQGILGGFSNKVGNIVGRQRKGKNGGVTVMSVYQPHVFNPNTEQQQMWRYRFTTISKLSSLVYAYIGQGFKNARVGMETVMNVFMRKNILDVFTGTWPELSLAYNKLVFSSGSLDLPFNPAATASETAITFTWTDNSGVGNAAATDKANVLIYNTSQHAVQTVLEAAARTAATYSYTYPTAWAGDEVELYFFMSNAAATNNSPSVYLGNITL